MKPGGGTSTEACHTWGGQKVYEEKYNDKIGVEMLTIVVVIFIARNRRHTWNYLDFLARKERQQKSTLFSPGTFPRIHQHQSSPNDSWQSSLRYVTFFTLMIL